MTPLRAEAVRQSEVATQKANERASTLEIVESNLVVAQVRAPPPR